MTIDEDPELPAIRAEMDRWIAQSRMRVAVSRLRNENATLRNKLEHARGELERLLGVLGDDDHAITSKVLEETKP